MTNLTEQWEKGELKLGEHYYYTTIFSPTVYIQNFTRDVVNFQDFKETVAEVLAPVPSYEEYQKLKESRAELNSDIADKAYENAMLKSEYEKECHRADELEDSYWKEVEKNKKLKDLLKECKDTMNKAGYLFAKIDDVKKAKRLLKQIEEVIK